MLTELVLPESLQIRASFVPESFDEKARTIDVVFATETPVRRSTWDGEFDEILGLGEGEVDLSFLRAGAPVFYSHGISWGMHSSELKRSHIGVVEEPKIERTGGVARAVCRLRFSERAEVAEILADVRSGVLTGVSNGYRVEKYQDTTPPAPTAPPGVAAAASTRAVPQYRAVKWVPKEVSLTPMPADPNSRVRSHDAAHETLVRVPLLRSDTDGDAGRRAGESGEKAKMDTPVAGGAAVVPAAVVPPAPDAEVLKRAAADAVKTERERATWIRSECKRQGRGEEIAEDLVRTGAEREASRDRILDETAKRGVAGSVQSHVRVGDEARDKVRAQVEQALLVRASVLESAKAAGNPLVGAPLLRLAEECVRASGVQVTSFAPGAIAGLVLRTSGMGTTDFPKITANVANKAMRKAYELAQPTYRRLAVKETAADFKTLSRINLGAGGLPEELNEHGEPRQVTLTETQETYRIKTWSKLMNVTRQLLINDDAGAFTSLPSRLGANLGLLEDIKSWALISSNPLLADGAALFVAGHANELTPDNALAETSLSGLRKLLRLQTDPDGNILGLTGRLLIVPAALETAAQKITTQVAPTATSGVNPFAGLEVIVVPHLDANSATRHYLAAAPELLPVLGYAYLNGAEGPTIEEFVEANFDGYKLRLLHDWNAGILDHRGIARSSGTT